MFDVKLKSRPQPSVAEGGVTPARANVENIFEGIIEGFIWCKVIKNDSENVAAEFAILGGCGGGHVSPSQLHPSAILSTRHVKLNIMIVYQTSYLRIRMNIQLYKTEKNIARKALGATGNCP
jgi:hypothetical protein